MEALIGISFKALTYEPPKAPDPERLSAAAAEAQSRVLEETEEWEIADEEGGDGGSAVKLLPAAEMHEARAFQQGLNRATKAEDKLNRNYARGMARNRQRDHRGGKGTNRYDEEYPALKPSIERKGEIKYHAANEKRMREKAAQESDDDHDGWGWIGEADGKAVVKENAGATEPPGNPKTQTSSTATSQNSKTDPNYILPHKRAVQALSRNEPEKTAKDNDNGNSKENLIDLEEDEPTENPPPPQRLMARLQMLNACEDETDGGVPLI